jgi:hypothetical protein
VDHVTSSDSKACPECRASWAGVASKLFKTVPNEIFEQEETDDVYRDSTKTKMVIKVLQKCLFNLPLTNAEPMFSIKDKEEKEVSLEEVNQTF